MKKKTRGEIEALIAALPPSLAGLAARGVVNSYPKGSVLIVEGDVGDTLYLILAGRLRAYSRNPVHGREVTYAVYGPGEYVGELGLDGGQRSASVETVEPTVCAMIRRQTLEAHIAENPSFAIELLGRVIGRARAATQMARRMALNDVYGRLKELLESLARPGPYPRVIDEKLTHLQIAQRIGCGREMVSRVMKDLEVGGYVDHDAEGRLRLLRPLPPGR